MKTNVKENRSLLVAKNKSLMNSDGFYIDGEIEVVKGIKFFRLGYLANQDITKTNKFGGSSL